MEEAKDSGAQGAAGSSKEALPDVVTIFPPAEGGMDLVDFPPIRLAQQDLAHMAESNATVKEEQVNVVVDDEVDDQVVELLGVLANLGFALEDMDLRFLVMHVKNVQRYLRFELVVQGQDDKVYHLSSSNRQTVVRTKLDRCSLPLMLKPGWNRVCLDLDDVCRRAFGVAYRSTLEVRVFANCRLWRMFFQDKDYADSQLPVELRVVQPSSPSIPR